MLYAPVEYAGAERRGRGERQGGATRAGGTGGEREATVSTGRL